MSGCGTGSTAGRWSGWCGRVLNYSCESAVVIQAGWLSAHLAGPTHLSMFLPALEADLLRARVERGEEADPQAMARFRSLAIESRDVSDVHHDNVLLLTPEAWERLRSG